MTLATVLVLFIIAVELYRPIIIGNAIDQYINGYYHPYVEADVSASDAINWNGLVLSRDQAVSTADSASFYQIFLWKDHYYMAENLTRSECTALQNADTSVLKSYVREGAQKLTSNDLKVLRQNDFKGILRKKKPAHQTAAPWSRCSPSCCCLPGTFRQHPRFQELSVR